MDQTKLAGNENGNYAWGYGMEGVGFPMFDNNQDLAVRQEEVGQQLLGQHEGSIQQQESYQQVDELIEQLLEQQRSNDRTPEEGNPSLTVTADLGTLEQTSGLMLLAAQPLSASPIKPVENVYDSTSMFGTYSTGNGNFEDMIKQQQSWNNMSWMVGEGTEAQEQVVPMDQSHFVGFNDQPGQSGNSEQIQMEQAAVMDREQVVEAMDYSRAKKITKGQRKRKDPMQSQGFEMEQAAQNPSMIKNATNGKRNRKTREHKQEFGWNRSAHQGQQAGSNYLQGEQDVMMSNAKMGSGQVGAGVPEMVHNPRRKSKAEKHGQKFELEQSHQMNACSNKLPQSVASFLEQNGIMDDTQQRIQLETTDLNSTNGEQKSRAQDYEQDFEVNQFAQNSSRAQTTTADTYQMEQNGMMISSQNVGEQFRVVDSSLAEKVIDGQQRSGALKHGLMEQEGMTAEPQTEHIGAPQFPMSKKLLNEQRKRKDPMLDFEEEQFPQQIERVQKRGSQTAPSVPHPSAMIPKKTNPETINDFKNQIRLMEEAHAQSDYKKDRELDYLRGCVAHLVRKIESTSSTDNNEDSTSLNPSSSSAPKQSKNFEQARKSFEEWAKIQKMPRTQIDEGVDFSELLFSQNGIQQVPQPVYEVSTGIDLYRWTHDWTRQDKSVKEKYNNIAEKFKKYQKELTALRLIQPTPMMTMKLREMREKEHASGEGTSAQRSMNPPLE